MNRNYVGWYKLKAELEKQEFLGNYSEREVWWASIGVNIGDEEDGKNRLFERPALVVKKYSKQLFLALPLSTAIKMNRFYHPIAVGDMDSIVLLSQARVISSKRLQRRMGRITSDEYDSILRKYVELNGLIKSDSQQAESPRAPNGDLYPHSTKPQAKSQAKKEKA